MSGLSATHGQQDLKLSASMGTIRVQARRKSDIERNTLSLWNHPPAREHTQTCTYGPMSDVVSTLPLPYELEFVHTVTEG
jgi:hypothetical protein